MALDSHIAQAISSALPGAESQVVDSHLYDGISPDLIQSFRKPPIRPESVASCRLETRFSSRRNCDHVPSLPL
jgi:hypothetical protein